VIGCKGYVGGKESYSPLNQFYGYGNKTLYWNFIEVGGFQRLVVKCSQFLGIPSGENGLPYKIDTEVLKYRGRRGVVSY